MTPAGKSNKTFCSAQDSHLITTSPAERGVQPD
ncbi:hypothetical protein METHPM2_1000006 [Pseudomonas sp. PM2]